jgi:hypothetical protein
VVRYEKRVATTGPKLMNNGPEGRRAKATFDLGDIADLAPAKPDADNRVDAMVGVPHFLLQESELRAERLHCLERLAKEASLGFPDLVHEY